MLDCVRSDSADTKANPYLLVTPQKSEKHSGILWYGQENRLQITCLFEDREAS